MSTNTLNFRNGHITMNMSFQSLKDLQSKIFGANKLSHDHKAFVSVTSDRTKVISRANSITPEMMTFTVTVPQNFSGNLMLFSEDLVSALNFCQTNIVAILSGVNMDVGSVINNVHEMAKYPPKTIVKCRQAAKELDNLTKKLNAYFRGNSDHAILSSIVRSHTEVEDALIMSGTVSESLRWVNDDEIRSKTITLVNSLSLLEEALKDPEVHSFESNRTYNEILEESITASKLVEFYGYVYALSLQYFGCVSSIVKQLSIELK